MVSHGPRHVTGPLRESNIPCSPYSWPHQLFCRTDRMSISSYRTDISMADFKNSRDLGGNDNMGASPDTQETVVEGKDGMYL